MPLAVILNGQARTFEGLASPVRLEQLVEKMGLRGDRIAVEHNGEIAARANWSQVWIESGDRVEVVHFVGGGGSKRGDQIKEMKPLAYGTPTDAYYT